MFCEQLVLFGKTPNSGGVAMARNTQLILLQKNTLHELTRYLFAGLVASCVDFSLLFLLTGVLGFNYLGSNLFCCTAGMITAYTLNIHWVFSERHLKKLTNEFATFVLIGLGGIGLNELCMFLAVDRCAINYLAAKIIATGAAFSFNFVLRKLLLFSPCRQTLNASYQQTSA